MPIDLPIGLPPILCIERNLRKKEIMYEGAYTLGDFIKKLKTLEQDKPIEFGFGGAVPTEFDSYRGYYAEIALGYEGAYGTSAVLVSELLEKAEACIGETFQGWKGGDFTMNEDTNLFVANSGNTSDTHITGVGTTEYGGYLILTKYTPFEG